MNKESILGIIRHILTFGGGFMTQNGIATDSEVTTGVSAAVTLVGVIWSILSKKKSTKYIMMPMSYIKQISMLENILMSC